MNFDFEEHDSPPLRNMTFREFLEFCLTTAKYSSKASEHPEDEKGMTAQFQLVQPTQQVAEPFKEWPEL